MDIEFHYYINYLIALKAGFSNDQAYLIAYSAQFIDDNDKMMPNHFMENYITYTSNVFNSAKLLQKIYLCYHFIPSGVSDERCDGLTHHLCTSANSHIANDIFDHALISGNPYMIGIASHAFSDTWAHQNFVGGYSNFNASQSVIGALIPNIGHADYLFSPDRIGHIWYDRRLTQQRVINNSRFLDCAEKIFNKYKKFLGSKLSKNQEDLDELIRDLSFAINQRSRFQAYQEISYKYSNQSIPIYSKNSWHKDLSKHKSSSFQLSNWYLFQNAVKNYQKYAWQVINCNFNLNIFN